MKPTIIDVSSSQRGMDLEAAKRSGIEGVIVKLTEGETFESPTWLSHSRDVHAAGMFLGSYHYGRPGTPVVPDAEREVEHYVEFIRKLEADGIKQDIYPAIDLEEGKHEISDADLLHWTAEFADGVCAALEVSRALVYVNGSYLKHLGRGATALGSDLGLSRHLVWFAGSDPEFEYTEIWESPSLWQTMDRQTDWYGGRIDQNVTVDPLSTLLIESGPEYPPVGEISAKLDCIDYAASNILRLTGQIRTLLLG